MVENDEMFSFERNVFRRVLWRIETKVEIVESRLEHATECHHNEISSWLPID